MRSFFARHYRVRKKMREKLNGFLLLVSRLSNYLLYMKRSLQISSFGIDIETETSFLVTPIGNFVGCGLRNFEECFIFCIFYFLLGSINQIFSNSFLLTHWQAWAFLNGYLIYQIFLVLKFIFIFLISKLIMNKWLALCMVSIFSLLTGLPNINTFP